MDLRNRPDKRTPRAVMQCYARLRPGILGLCLAVIATSPLRADPFSSAVSSMFGAMGSMANMMAVMMSPAGSYTSGWSPTTAFSGLPAYGMVPGWNQAITSPYSMIPGTVSPLSPFTAPNTNALQNQPSLFSQNTGTGNLAQSSPGNFWLNGQWQTTTGEMLYINGKNFRLLSRMGAIEGFVTSNADLLSLYVPQIRQTMLFLVKLESNTLTLKEPNGNTQTFYKISQ